MPALQKEMQASSTSNFRYFTCLLDKGHINMQVVYCFAHLHFSVGRNSDALNRLNPIIKKQQWLFQSLLLRTDVPIVSETHKSSDFINLLKKLNEKYPEGDIIRIVCDNHSAHKSKETTNFLATCPEGRFVLSRIFCMRCDQFLFLIYDDRHCFSPSAPNLFPVKYLCLVRS